VRALPRERPATLTAPPDGQTLEVLIGELQSEYGVPQYPQEYRITLKVADERDRTERSAPEEPAPPPAQGNGSPRREKAPAMGATGGAAAGEKLPGPSRKRSRRRRRRRGSGGGSAPGAGGGQPS
jgi:hypothetical protein